MSKKITPTQGNAGAKHGINLQGHSTPKRFKRQAYCQNCKYFCDPETTRKHRTLKYVRKFCYMNGETVTPKQRACSFYGEGAI